MNEIHFTSDTHFGHANIIKFVNRPYISVEEMDEGLIENWNSVVKENDTVYHLGDVAYWRRYDPTPVIKRLNGSIHLVLGNHDWDLLNWPLVKERMASIQNFKEITVGKHELVLCHYALRVWNKSHYGAIALFGHSHGSLEPFGKSVDVGVDSPYITGTPEYRPFNLGEIIEFMDRREFVQVDGHKP